jgi:uncharacterized membrane protein
LVLPASTGGVTLGEKALWPSVVIIFIVCGLIATLLIADIDVVSIIAVFSVLGNVVLTVLSLMLYGKMQKVEQNTNGVLSTQLDMIKDLMNQGARTAAKKEDV